MKKQQIFSFKLCTLFIDSMNRLPGIMDLSGQGVD